MKEAHFKRCYIIDSKVEHVYTLFGSNVRHGETLHVKDDGRLHYSRGRTFEFLEIGIDSGNAAFNQVNDVHDVVFLLD